MHESSDFSLGKADEFCNKLHTCLLLVELILAGDIARASEQQSPAIWVLEGARGLTKLVLGHGRRAECLGKTAHDAERAKVTPLWRQRSSSLWDGGS